MKTPTKTMTKQPPMDATKAKMMAKSKKKGEVKIAEAGQPANGTKMAMPTPADMANMKKTIKQDRGAYKR